jgi:serine phosphatase RsbU (regulator of sigma subunit)
MKFTTFIFCFLAGSFLSAQQNVDSLIQKIKTTTQDTSKLDLLIQIAEICSEDSELKKYNDQAFILATQLSNSKIERLRRKGYQGLSATINNKGYLEINKNNSLGALDFFQKALNLKINNHDSIGLAGVYSNLGAVMDKMGKLEKAIDYYLLALSLKETQKNPDLKGTILGNIGSVYNNLGKHQKALDYFLEDIKLKSFHNNSQNLGIAYSNIGPIYRNLGNYREAFKCAYKALSLAKANKDVFLESQAYSRLGDFYASSRQYDSALYYSQKSLELSEKIGDFITTATEYGNIGYINIQKKQYKQSELFLLRSYHIYDSLNIIYEKKITSKLLSTLYDSIKDYKKALFFYKVNSVITDSLFKNENKEALIKQGMQMEFDKKEAILKEEQDKERIIAKEKSQQQKIIIWSVISGLSLVIIFSFIIFNRLQITRKQNFLIEKQKNEAEEQKNIIAEQKRIVDDKQNEIISSINYAQRIQSAVLTGEEVWNKISKEHFIVFQPRDIVSGDFYWAHVLPNGRAVFVLADCTGHGVPGGFMSMLGNSFLNELVVENKLFKADEILNRLREKVIAALFQKGQTEQKDGMDMALCVWNKMDNTIEFAGANNSIYIVRQKELMVFKGDKMPIGSYVDNTKKFTSQKISLCQNDMVYLNTDGYVDQFGGEKGKKFKAKQLEDLLVTVSVKSLEEQKNAISETFFAWKNDHEQTDDVSLIGIKIT